MTTLTILPLQRSTHVCRLSSKLHVVRVEAHTIIAQMINGHSFRNVVLEPREHQTVGKVLSILRAQNNGVGITTIVVITIPFPTRVGSFDFVPQSPEMLLPEGRNRSSILYVATLRHNLASHKAPRTAPRPVPACSVRYDDRLGARTQFLTFCCRSAQP